MKKKIIIVFLIIGFIFVYIAVKAIIDKNHLNTETEENVIIKNANLENISKSKDVVNVYFFWGEGCPHCKEEFAWLESISKKYKKTFKVYGFEVWYNENNYKLLNDFADKLNQEVEGIPCTIIGEKVFIGFKEASKKEIITAIKDYQKKDFDVYINKMSEEN